ncbi:hypothetical protein GCM10011390_32060 [Aureimonas endophytica]|uniref:DUF1972 domain-containing protein n=1 Tax=Aureimonas endophytica TaxID=2027858 RepID=A0A916ZRH1_9HYPH|nr:hypothetical protein GCM10011390_32060 [Aureimonas endophytica]
MILGTRGIPAAHGGFETFAEHLALFLVDRGWKVGVYCQDQRAVSGSRLMTETWRGIDLLHVAVPSEGPLSTLVFDWHCVRDAARRDAVNLVLGYNGAAFLPYLRLHGRRVVTNMDGIEWRRAKWGMAAKTWFWTNEWIAAWTSHRMIADHPAIADHLATRRARAATAMIPYGSDMVTDAPVEPVTALGLSPQDYLVSIARLEPDNSILPMVEGFSRRPRGKKLAVLGNLDPAIPYHRALLDAAGPEVVFTGGLYDPAQVQALRFHAFTYLHGHTVGGTNPSLVESLAAGNAVIAHDNAFNRWTAGAAARFFRTGDEFVAALEARLAERREPGEVRAIAWREAARFDWPSVLGAYEAQLLEQTRPAVAPDREPRPAEASLGRPAASAGPPPEIAVPTRGPAE